MRLSELPYAQQLIFEYDEPQRRAILRLAEVHNAVIVGKEIQTSDGHWRIILEPSA